MLKKVRIIMHQHCNEVLPLCQLQARNHLWYRLLKAQKAIWNFRQVKACPQNSSTVHDSQINPINYCKAVFQVNIKNILKKQKKTLYCTLGTKVQGSYQLEKYPKCLINKSWEGDKSRTNSHRPSSSRICLVSITNILQILAGNLENFQE